MQMKVTRDATTVDERRQMAVASHADACDETRACRWKHKVHSSRHSHCACGCKHNVHLMVMSHMAQGVRGMWYMREGALDLRGI